MTNQTIAEMFQSGNLKERKLGAPVPCPRCGRPNPSGFYNVEDCRWCGKFGIDKGLVIGKPILSTMQDDSLREQYTKENKS